MSDEHQDKDFRREMPPDMRIPDYQTWDIGGKITVENSDKTNKFYFIHFSNYNKYLNFNIKFEKKYMNYI